MTKAWLAMTCVCAACVGEIADAGSAPRVPAPSADTRTLPQPAAPSGRPSPSAGPSPLRRLGQLELHNTLRDLFPSLPADFDAALELPADNAVQLAFAIPGSVSDLEVKRFMELAETTLNALGANAPQRQAACSGDANACARTFIQDFGKRAFRRPLDAAELDDLMALYSQLRGDPDLAEDALGIVSQAMLQAPGFLYRWERGLQPAQRDGALVKYDDYEMAARLSYWLWNSLPDAPLMAAAERGQLRTPEQIAAQAERLLADPRADAALSDFIAQWLELGPLPQALKDSAVYPDWQPELAAAMQAESLALGLDVLRGPEPTFENLLGARYTFVNAALASYYEVTPDRDGRVDLTRSARRGLLTSGALMAVKGNSYRTSPVRRGKFILNRLLCTSVPPPPPNVVPELPPPDPTKTVREQMAMHRDNPVCASCHDRMDNLGFAFEHFDGAGKYREDEHGHAIDASGETTLDGAQLMFRDASELIEALAHSPEARTCYVRQWLRYALDRFEVDGDEVALQALATSYRDTHALILDITRSLPFTHRAAAEGEELGP